jgi:HlyD family secretion protein
MAAPRRRWWWIGGGAVAAVVAWLVAQPAGVVVEVATVTRGPLAVTVVESGETRAVNRTEVSAPVAGLLRPVVREAGATVLAGALLAVIEPVALDPGSRPEAEARLARADALRARADALLRSADSALTEARRAAARTGALVRAGAVAARDAEQDAIGTTTAEDARGSAAAAVREAAAEWRAARAALAAGGAPVPVRAPVAGRVLAVHEPDRRVVPPGTPLLSLGDTERIEVHLEVLSRDALRVVAGQPMRLDVGAGLDDVPGEVVRVEPGGFARRSPLGVEERRVRVVGRPLRPLPGVGDGYRVQATIVVWAADSVRQVPASAFVRDADGWAVFTVADGRIRRRAVVPGERGAQVWEVREGLDLGEAVVRFPEAGLRAGARARAVR